MLNDEHFKVVRYFSDSKEVFSSVDIKGGVIISLRNNNEIYGKIKFFSPVKELDTIISKIESIEGECYQSISNIVSSRGNYRFSKLFFQVYPSAKQKLGTGTGDMIVSNVFEKFPEAFTDVKQNSNDYKILGRFKNTRVYRYINCNYVQDNIFLQTYNVVIPKSNGTGLFGEILSTPIICMKNECATDTFISIGFFENKQQAESMLKYLKTKFLRALLGARKVTQDNPKSTWENIPIQDFSNNSDIDWSKPIHEIDLQLYNKYALTENEINFIEDRVQQMI